MNEWILTPYRIETIESIANKLAQLTPRAKYGGNPVTGDFWEMREI